MLEALIFAFCPVRSFEDSWNIGNIVIIVVVTLVVMTIILFTTRKQAFEQEIVVMFENSDAEKNRQLEKAKKDREWLNNTRSFYVVTTEQIGKSIQAGKKDFESLARIFAAVMQQNIVKITGEDDFIINHYELRDGIVKMILSYAHSQYCRREAISAPLIFKAKNGIDIKDKTIQDYYCIKCIRGKAKGKSGVFTADWKTIVREFKWDGWADVDREDIIRRNDRDQCVRLGFRYYQYIAFKVERDDGTVGLFEIIANEAVVPDKELERFAHRLDDMYCSLLDVLWDISADSSMGGSL